MQAPVNAVVIGPRQNRLLAALPDADYQRLLPALEPVSLPLGQVLYEAGGSQPYVYFPTDSIISLLYVMEDGASAEIAVTGCEGLVGIALFMGGETTPSRAVVQSAGAGYRLRAAVLKKEFDRGGVCITLRSGIRRRSLRRWRRPPCVTGTTRWSSNCAAGCCSAWTGCPPTSSP